MSTLNRLDARVSEAVRYFWRTRQQQQRKQGGSTGPRDHGSRGAVTGGAQLNGFIRLVNDLLTDSGLPEAEAYTRQTTLPGYFRATKDWDLVVVIDGTLLATIEFKSQVGSFGNNFNNRVEEALGNATDLWTAYREGAFAPSARPWLGYMMLLEEAPGSIRPVRTSEPYFPVFREYKEASYARRYELFCERLVRERLYDAACFLLSDRRNGLRGHYKEPSSELNFRNFATSLAGHAGAFAKRIGRQ